MSPSSCAFPLFFSRRVDLLPIDRNKNHCQYRVSKVSHFSLVVVLCVSLVVLDCLTGCQERQENKHNNIDRMHTTCLNIEKNETHIEVSRVVTKCISSPKSVCSLHSLFESLYDYLSITAWYFRWSFSFCTLRSLYFFEILSLFRLTFYFIETTASGDKEEKSQGMRTHVILFFSCSTRACNAAQIVRQCVLDEQLTDQLLLSSFFSDFVMQLTALMLVFLGRLHHLFLSSRVLIKKESLFLREHKRSR